MTLCDKSRISSTKAYKHREFTAAQFFFFIPRVIQLYCVIYFSLFIVIVLKGVRSIFSTCHKPLQVVNVSKLLPRPGRLGFACSGSAFGIKCIISGGVISKLSISVDSWKWGICIDICHDFVCLFRYIKIYVLMQGWNRNGWRYTLRDLWEDFKIWKNIAWLWIGIFRQPVNISISENPTSEKMLF